MDRHRPEPGQSRSAPASALAVSVSHIVAQAALAKMLPRLEAAGIASLLVKGVVTAHELYNDPGERPIRDIDLRVVPERFEDLLRVARQERWTLRSCSKPYRNVVIGLGNVEVDVECAVGPPGLCALRVGDMLGRAVWIRPPRGGPAMRKPELHDHAVLLCVNLFKDKLTRAAPWAVTDVLRVAALPAFDGDHFIARARASDVASIAWIVADWMASEHGSAPWGAVLARIGGAPRPLYARAYRALGARDDGSLALRLLARAGADSRRRQALALATAVYWAGERRCRRGPPGLR
jgi:hypothetical protein